MVSGFSLTPGYIYTKEQEISVKQLQVIASQVGKDQQKFYRKCIEYGLQEDLSSVHKEYAGEQPCTCKLGELLKVYEHLPTKDGTCNFTEWGILQSTYAGNGSQHRLNREQICRAFAMLVLDECYKKGYSVSFTIS
jgi:hypothetical protein